ncbi:MAG: hypothetical protein IJF12_03700 [Alphaproteobacteria bacterium]|nr:hypothetical protein [Alphaproteobacteria bacterium]
MRKYFLTTVTALMISGTANADNILATFNAKATVAAYTNVNCSDLVFGTILYPSNMDFGEDGFFTAGIDEDGIFYVSDPQVMHNGQYAQANCNLPAREGSYTVTPMTSNIMLGEGVWLNKVFLIYGDASGETGEFRFGGELMISDIGDGIANGDLSAKVDIAIIYQ